MADFKDPIHVDNDFDPSTPSLENETPTLDQVILAGVDYRLYDLHTWLPAKVVNVREDGTVDLQPLIMRSYIDGTVTPLPVIQQCPVQHPSGEDWWVKCPIAIGDVGRATFCERSLDNWIVQGGMVDSEDVRKHHLSDAVFVPGLRPASHPLPGNATDMVLHNGKAEVYLQKGGTFKMTNGTNEVLAQLVALVQALQNALVNTMMGPEPFMAVTQTDLATILTALNTLKGN